MKPCPGAAAAPTNPVVGSHRTYRLVPYGRDAPAPARVLAELHAALLPDSPLARMGRRFTEDFYYRLLPRLGLIFGAVAYVDADPAGFVAATDDSAGFMKTAVRRAGPQLLITLGRTLISRPSEFGPMVEAWRAFRCRPGTRASPVRGEILSLGVVPRYREPGFVRASGLRISLDLVSYAVQQLRDRGLREILALVATENTAAKLLYKGLGWALETPDPREWPRRPAAFVWRE